MHRRALLAAPAVAPALAALPAAAQSAPRIVSEDAMVPSGDPGIELFLRNKRPESLNAFQPNRTLLMVHGATYPAHTAFDLPLGGVSWMDTTSPTAASTCGASTSAATAAAPARRRWRSPPPRTSR